LVTVTAPLIRSVSAEEERDQRVRVQLCAEIGVIGDGEQVEPVPVRLAGEPGGRAPAADVRAIPGAQRGAEKYPPICHH
jgi:hypothetical protein